MVGDKDTLISCEKGFDPTKGSTKTEFNIATLTRSFYFKLFDLEYLNVCIVEKKVDEHLV